MKISSDCFADSELKSIIKSKKHSGFCDVLKARKDFIYDTETDSELRDLIIDLINIYRVANEDVPQKSRVYLKDELITKWNIFAEECKPHSLDIIRAIISSDISFECESIDEQLFIQEIYIPQLLNEDFVKNNSILYGGDWDNFCENIKHVNRYHAKQFNSSVFESFVTNLATSFNTKTQFYRARINKTNDIYKESDMKMPPRDRTKPGRVSAESIPCFYLASDVETSICEVRAGAHDVVNVATFVNSSILNVVDFRYLDKMSPFEVNDILVFYINKPVFLSIKKEIEKPLRSTENTVDYVPIQFLCDYIRSLNYDGVIYGSTMNENGFNISLFSDNDFVCKSINSYKIKKINYQYKQLNK